MNFVGYLSRPMKELLRMIAARKDKLGEASFLCAFIFDISEILGKTFARNNYSGTLHA